MQKDQYINEIKEKLGYYYDVCEDKIIDGSVFDLYAVSNVKNSKYMGSKKIVIYAYENNSFIYLKLTKNLSIELIKTTLDTHVDKLLNSTNADDEHMSTHYTFVFICEDNISKDVINFIKKYRKQKSHAFGFKGWSSIGIVAVSLENSFITYNKDATKIYKAFKPL